MIQEGEQLVRLDYQVRRFGTTIEGSTARYSLGGILVEDRRTALAREIVRISHLLPYNQPSIFAEAINRTLPGFARASVYRDLELVASPDGTSFYPADTFKIELDDPIDGVVSSPVGVLFHRPGVARVVKNMGALILKGQEEIVVIGDSQKKAIVAESLRLADILSATYFISDKTVFNEPGVHFNESS